MKPENEYHGKTDQVLDRLRHCCDSPPADHPERCYSGNRARLAKLLSEYDISPSSLDRWRKGECRIRTVYVTILDKCLAELGF